MKKKQHLQMSKILIIPGRIVTVNSSNDILSDHAIEIKDNIITRIALKRDFDFRNYSAIYSFPGLVLIPGFIQTHVHLCQTLFRGLADDLELLDWLQKRIFPYEYAHNRESLKISVQLGINELQLSGTTTILDMGTLKHQDVIFEELNNSGMRAIAGKCMMDENDLFPAFRSSTCDELMITQDLANTFHNSGNGLIKYGFAPRFVLSCSEKLLVETNEMMKDFPGSIYHTHSSENRGEIEAVRRKYQKDNIEYFHSINVLSENTVLAHCIHTNEKEIGILKNTGTRVSHCPSSNLKLASGIANIPLYMKEGISVSLGADGAPCNNNLNAFTEMRLAALIQKPIHGPTVMDALTIFRMATIDGARALSLDKKTGSIEEGKAADLVLLDLNSPHNSFAPEDSSIYSNIVYTCDKSNVKFVMINGEWAVSNGINQTYEQGKLSSDAKLELSKLLKRVYVN